MNNKKFFVKFAEKQEHLVQLQEGSIRFGSPHLYCMFNEDESNRSGVKNIHENTLLECDNVRVKLDDINHIPIFCLSEFEFEAKDNHINIVEIEKLEQLGNYALLINKDEFIENIEKAGDKLGYNIIGDNVIYSISLDTFNPKDPNHHFNKQIALATKTQQIVCGDITKDNLFPKALFRQHQSHSYQNEYRFCILNKYIHNYFCMKVNPIFGYSLLIKTKDILEINPLTELSKHNIIDRN